MPRVEDYREPPCWLFGWMFGAIIGLLIGAYATGPRVDKDLRDIQRQRNAWAAYQEANR